MSNYRNGVYLEVRSKELLAEAGYLVVRAAGSHGLADLVGLHPDRPPVMVQCKTSGGMSHGDWNRLYATAHHVHAVPLVSRWNLTHRKIVWAEVCGLHEERSRQWPMQEWSP